MRTDAFSLISGAGMGAGLMYFLDPDRGRRRRALMRDKSIRWSRKTREFAGSASRDVRNRATGVGAGLKSWMQPASSVPDRVLAERIRSKLGMYSRHPSAIDVHVTDGTVTISGPVMADEADRICHTVARMPGVKQLFNRLERHHSPDNVPALQGTIGHKVGPRFAFMQAHWSPTAQIAAAAVGMAALLYSLKRRTAGAATLGVSGLALLVRTATNAEFSRIFNLAEHYFEKAA